VVTNAGGPGIIAADSAERMGISLPHMSRENIEAMKALLPPNASLFNPVDVIGDATSKRYAAVLEQAVKDPNIDAMLVILTPQAMTDVERTAEVVIATAQSTDKPVIASFMGEARIRTAVGKLKEASVPNFPYPELAVKAFRRLADHRAWKDARAEEPPSTWYDFDSAHATISGLLGRGDYQVGEDDAAAVLSYYGFRFPRRILARTAKDAAAAAEKLGLPVVMKIASPDILHKTDVGGVRVNVRTAKEAEEVFLETTTNARRHMPDAFIRGVAVSEMITGGKEVILGVTCDRTFGHMIMAGLGGIYVEVLKDVSFRIVPVSPRDALSMVNELRTVGLLRGARGERPADIDAVASAIVNLSSLVADFPEIQELDINPLMVMERGAVAVDARIIFTRQAR
jgi:acetyltransferase